MSAASENLRALAKRSLPLGLRVAVKRLPPTLRWLWQRRAGLLLAGGALERARFTHLQAERATPLRRPGVVYEESMQRGKEQNVARAMALVDGCVVEPGALFSWHQLVGPPLRLRGFIRGPEVHGGRLEQGVGGGLCQVTNLLFWLAVHSGMEIVERHGHDLDLFPDHDRTAPFGCGATVFFPSKDLRFRNPLRSPLLLELHVASGSLIGRARLTSDPGARWEVIEADPRFIERGGEIWRQNRLLRRRRDPDGRILDEPLADNAARVLYPVSPNRLVHALSR